MSPTTFSVDPVVGDDAHSGVDSDHPWRSFAPLGSHVLGPGDRINLFPGTYQDTLWVKGEGTLEAPITVSLAPGRYDLHTDRQQRRSYHISNTNDGVDSPKAIGLFLDHASHVHIDGAGARLVCRGKMIEICVDHAEAITVSGLSFDYHRPTVSEFTVESTTTDSADLTVHPDSAYEIKDGTILWVGEDWSYPTGLAQELVPETHAVRRRKDPLHGLRVEAVSDGHLRVHGSHDMTAGRVFQIRNTFRDGVGVLMNESRDVRFANMKFHYMHGMGILCQFTENITLDAVSIAPDPGSGRTTAAWADCFHASGCKGSIVVRDCTFNGAHDDAINIHGTYLRIVEQSGPRTLRLGFMHRQTFGLPAFRAGDVVDYVRADSLATFATGLVESAELLGSHAMRVTMCESIPRDWRFNDVVENVTWSPDVDIRGCTAMRIPSRGFLLTTRRPVLVEGCRFVSLQHGIHVASDASSWFESGAVQDMKICNNYFENSKAAAIRINPENRVANDRVHGNIQIIGNTFCGGEWPVIEARGCTGLTVCGNQARAVTGDSDAVLITDCADITMRDNDF